MIMMIIIIIQFHFKMYFPQFSKNGLHSWLNHGMSTFTIALELSASAHVDVLICRRAQTGSVASRLILCTCNHRRHSRSSKSTCACVTGCDSALASAHVDSCVVPFAVRCLQKQTLAVALIHTCVLFICKCLSEHPRSLYRWILNHPKP